MNRLIFYSLMIFSFSLAHAEQARIFTGGRYAANILNKEIDALQKVAGVDLEIKSTPAAFSLKSLSDGLAIGLVHAGDLADFWKSTDAKDLKSFKMEDFESVHLSDATIKFGINPAAGIKTLTDDQMRKVLLGEIKNWKELGGADLPIKYLIPKTLTGGNTTLPAVYKRLLKEGEKALEPEVVGDPQGVLRAMEKFAGTFTPFTAREVSPSLTPIFIETGVKRPSYFFIKKSDTGAGRKLFEHFKKTKLDTNIAWRE